LDYKDNINQLAIILEQIIEILGSVNEPFFIKTLRCFRGDCEYVVNEQEAHDLNRKILNFCRGGMGSFNDLVLSSEDGKILEEDAEFYKLKTKLFSVCVDIITKPRES